MAVHDLFATIWQVNTLVGTSMSEGLAAKKLNMTNAVKTAYTYMESVKGRMQAGNPVYLFVAPEYYWLKGAGMAHFNVQEKDEIFLHLQNLSATYKQLILVPGTVQWMVPKGDYKGITANPQRLNLAKTKNVAFNTTPVFFAGERILTYFKKFNDGEVEKKDALEAVYGVGPTGQGQTFEASGLKFGLEVCGDFNEGKLNASLAGGKVDVMVLTSATMPHDFATGIAKVPVRPGGAFVHCDASAKADSYGMDRNGLWIVAPGRGWHGSPDGVDYYSFVDLDNIRRIVGVPKKPANKGHVIVKTMQGFGATQSLTATDVVLARGLLTIKKFTITISGSGDYRTQTAVIARDDRGDWTVTLSRKVSFTKTFTKTSAVAVTEDRFGKRATGEGNVNKIGALKPSPGPSLWSYYAPIPDA